MDINDLVELGKHEIGRARKVSPVQAVTITQPVDNSSNDHLGPGIFAAYGGHIPAALLWRMNVHRYVNPFRIVRMKPSMSISCTPFTCG